LLEQEVLNNDTMNSYEDILVSPHTIMGENLDLLLIGDVSHHNITISRSTCSCTAIMKEHHLNREIFTGIQNIFKLVIWMALLDLVKIHTLQKVRYQ